MRLTPGTVLMLVSTLMKFLKAPSKLMPYPARMTVLPVPNQGRVQAYPTDGPKLCVSLPFRFTPIPEFGEFLPTNCTFTRLLHVESNVPGAFPIFEGH